MKEVIRIPYPTNPAGKKQWNKLYGDNAYWAGKHHALRAEDARYWHALTWAAMSKAKTRRTPFEKPVVITFLWNDRMDIGNHGMISKMVVDAMKKKILHDDNLKWVKGIEHYSHNEDCIKVIVREVET